MGLTVSSVQVGIFSLPTLVLYKCMFRLDERYHF